jgi:hypothetical protein
MIRPLVQYLMDEGVPRARQILMGSETCVAVVVATVCFIWGSRWFGETPRTGDLSTGLIAYSAIALGFCVAGLTISLTLPDREFASCLAFLKNGNDPTNGYSDLLFVFSWTAIAHWFTLVLLFLMMLFVKSDCPLFPTPVSDLHKLGVSIVAGACTYCLCQFLITLITLSQVGRSYIDHLILHPRERASKEPDKR